MQQDNPIVVLDDYDDLQMVKEAGEFLKIPNQFVFFKVEQS